MDTLLSFLGMPSKSLSSIGNEFFLVEVHLMQRLPKPAATTCPGTTKLRTYDNVHADADGKGPYATLFCKNKIGNTISLIVCGWKPWIRLLSLDPNTKPHKMFAFGKLLSKIDADTKEEKLKKLYGWIASSDMSTQDFHCLKIYLNSLHGSEKMVDDIKDEPRLVIGDFLQPQKTRFLNDTGLVPCSWFTASNINWLSDSDARWTTSQYEGIIHVNDLAPFKNDCEDVPPLLVASFDCEMSSKDNLFPSVYKGDTTFCISTAFGIFGQNQKIKKISLFLSDSRDFHCPDPDPDHQVQYFKTYSELFEAWRNIIIYADPDFITGWNTEGFDFDFLHQQYSLLFVDPIQRLDDVLAQQVIPNLISLEDLAKAAPKYLKKKILNDLFYRSAPPTVKLKQLLLDEVSIGFSHTYEDVDAEADEDDDKTLYAYGYGLTPDKHWELRKLLGDSITKYTIDMDLVKKLPLHQQEFISTPKRNAPRIGLYLSRFRTIDSDIKLQALSTSAKGDNFLIRIPMIGRVVFDMMRIIKEDQKPSSNSLRYAAETWLGEEKGKLDMPYEELFRIYNEKDTLKYNEIIEYCGRDAEIPLLLLFKLQYIVSWLNLCRVCYLSPDNIVNGGQQQRVFSLISRRVLHTHVINTEPSGWPESPDYVGATVMDPIPNFYDKPLSTLDFASLYPSIEAANNLCFSTLVTDRTQLSKLKDSDNRNLYQDFAIDHPLPDGSIETRKYAFVTHVKSVLADLLIHLLSSRKAVKKQMESTNDKFLKDIYNKRQAALKVVCNSVYGFTGTNVDKGMLSCKPVAAATTLIGRKLIGLTKAYVEEEYKPAKVVYGDTDSVMILWGTSSLEEAFHLGESAASKVTSYLRSIMKKEQISVIGKEQRDIDAMTSIVKLEHEKEYWPYVLFKKKNYAGRKWTPTSYQPLKLKNELDIKGIQAVRRDTVPWIADLSNDILDILLKIPDGTKPQTQTAIDLVKLRLIDLVENKIELDKFITSKSLAANYSSLAIPHVSAWNRMKQRLETNIPTIGSRMPFVFVASKDRKASLSSKAEHPDYVKKTGKKLDIKYYIKAAQNPIMKLLQFANDNTLDDIFKSAMNMDENKNTTFLDSFISTKTDTKVSIQSFVPSPPKKKLKKMIAETNLNAFL
jgi:DNA polymerase elongation subunit (family B)